MPDLGCVQIVHPMMTRTAAEIAEIADRFMPEAAALLTGAGQTEAAR